MFPEEIVQHIYRFRFIRRLRRVHRQIKKYVQDGHRRRRKYCDQLLCYDGKWSSCRDLNKTGRIAWGVWKDGKGHTAAAYVCEIFEFSNMALKNCYYTRKSHVKSDTKIMEAFPAFYLYSWRKKKEVLFRVKRLGHF